MDLTNPQQSLEQTIQRFIADAARVHEFTKGDSTVMVSGEDGDYPSLAKIAADTKAAIQTIIEQLPEQSAKVVSFADADEVIIEHNRNTKLFDYTILASDGARVFAPAKDVSYDSFTISFSAKETGRAVVRFYTDDTAPVKTE